LAPDPPYLLQLAWAGSTGYTERRKTKRKVKKLLCSLRWRRVEPKKTTAKTWTSFNVFLPAPSDE